MNNDNKATWIGAILAGMIAAQPFFTEAGFVWANDWPKLVIAVGIAALGFITNRKNVK